LNSGCRLIQAHQDGKLGFASLSVPLPLLSMTLFRGTDGKLYQQALIGMSTDTSWQIASERSFQQAGH